MNQIEPTRTKNHGFWGTPSPPGYTASMYHVRNARTSPSPRRKSIVCPIVIFWSGDGDFQKSPQCIPSAEIVSLFC